jgi:hypothetical protein
MGRPSVTPPTVLRRGSVTSPTIGRPFVVSPTVFRTLQGAKLAEGWDGRVDGEKDGIPSKQSTTAAVLASATVLVSAAAEESCHFEGIGYLERERLEGLLVDG